MVAWQVVGQWLVNATHAEGESKARKRLALTGGGTPGEAGVASPLRSCTTSLHRLESAQHGASLRVQATPYAPGGEPRKQHRAS